MQASSLEFWGQKWANGLDTWTKPTVNTLLVNHADRLPLNEDGPKRILMPLCGRSPDITWLLDQGYIVVGVEFVSDAILQFFAERKINYTLTDVPDIPGANLYKALEERLLIYQCNFLDLKADVIGLFDGVYDKAALVAISPSDYLKYIGVMRSVLKPTGIWLLLTVDLEVEGDQYRGPPFSLPFQAVAKLISSFFSCVEVHSCVDAEEAEVLKAEKNYTFDLTVRRSVIVIRPLSNMQASPLDFWAKAWADDRDAWTTKTVNPLLIKHADLLPPNEDKDNPKRILVPLCGRSSDMIWLVDKGYLVVGVELFPKGILKFFEEQKLEFEVTEVPEIPSAKLYTARDGRLLIYECNFFDLRKDVVGLFDGVYDRGSWVAIDSPDRPKYVETVKSLLRPTGTWLLLAIDIAAEGGEYKGPPFSLPFSTVTKSLPSNLSCTEVSSYLRPEMASSLKSLKKYTFDLTVVLPVIVIRSR